MLVMRPGLCNQEDLINATDSAVQVAKYWQQLILSWYLILGHEN